jgi:hypothetical protein
MNFRGIEEGMKGSMPGRGVWTHGDGCGHGGTNERHNKQELNSHYGLDSRFRQNDRGTNVDNMK